MLELYTSLKRMLSVSGHEAHTPISNRFRSIRRSTRVLQSITENNAHDVGSNNILQISR